MSKRYIGIDIGKTGFICVYDDKMGYLFTPIPLIGNVVDIKQINETLKIFNDKEYGGVFACIEDLHAIYGSSARGTWEFAFVAGIIETLLVSNNIPYVKIQPKKWQKIMFEGVPQQLKPSITGKTMVTDTKKMAEIAAKRLHPDLDLRKSERCRNNDHNKIDSLLLTDYIRRNF